MYISQYISSFALRHCIFRHLDKLTSSYVRIQVCILSIEVCENPQNFKPPSPLYFHFTYLYTIIITQVYICISIIYIHKVYNRKIL